MRSWMIVAYMVVLVGCATSPPARFYSLSVVGPERTSSPAGVKPPIIAIGPVTIPDVVNRPEIVTANGPNQTTVHDFERWAGSLDGNLSRVLIEDLASK